MKYPPFHPQYVQHPASRRNTCRASVSPPGFVSADAKDPSLYRYRPNSKELKVMLDRLAEIYARHLVPVTNLIHSKPKSRIQEFADAFQLRKAT